MNLYQILIVYHSHTVLLSTVTQGWLVGRCKITALKGFLYTDGPFRAVSRTVQIFNNMGRQKSRQNFTFL